MLHHQSCIFIQALEYRDDELDETDEEELVLSTSSSEEDEVEDDDESSSSSKSGDDVDQPKLTTMVLTDIATRAANRR